MNKRDPSQPELFSDLVSSQVPDGAEAKATADERKAEAPQSGTCQPEAPTNNDTDQRKHASGLSERYFSDRQVAALFGVARPTIWRWARAYSEFPQSVEVTPGTTRWLLSELEIYATSLKRKRGAK